MYLRCGGWEYTELEGSLSQPKGLGGAREWTAATDGKATRHVPTSPLTQRPCSMATLVPRFTLERRQLSKLDSYILLCTGSIHELRASITLSSHFTVVYEAY